MGNDTISAADLLGDREIALRIAQPLIGLLKVQRNRVVDSGADARGGQVLHELFPVLRPCTTNR